MKYKLLSVHFVCAMFSCILSANPPTMNGDAVQNVATGFNLMQQGLLQGIKQGVFEGLGTAKQGIYTFKNDLWTSSKWHVYGVTTVICVFLAIRAWQSYCMRWETKEHEKKMLGEAVRANELKQQEINLEEHNLKLGREGLQIAKENLEVEKQNLGLLKEILAVVKRDPRNVTQLHGSRLDQLRVGLIAGQERESDPTAVARNGSRRHSSPALWPSLNNQALIVPASRSRSDLLFASSRLPPLNSHCRSDSSSSSSSSSTS